MLTELHIEDLGVIASLDLVLPPGFTAFTGETGAGKTMIVEAISLLVGGRADTTVVRAGCAEARVEGRFVDGDDEFVVARVVPVDGRSRAYVNGRLATVATLAELGARFVDIHGQHAHQGLLGGGAQREALDRWAGTDLEPLRAARALVTEVDAALAALGGDARARAREVDLLEFQCGELDAAQIAGPDEDDRLAALEDLLVGAQSHRDAGERATGLLRDDDAAVELLGRAAAALTTHHHYGDLADRLRAASLEIADVADELRVRIAAIDDDPARLADVSDRRQLLRTLRRKYGETLADVLAFHAEVSARLDELHGYDDAVERLERDRAEAVARAANAAAVVGAARRSAADGLAVEVQRVVRTLAMPHAEVRIDVGGDDPGDEVTFLLSANPGTSPQPLAKVASGGELARAMLALRLILTTAPGTLVFDEVDAGIGGAVATVVGEALAAVAVDHQVIVVTHLAQVAALADHQVTVAKVVRDASTFATATALDAENRRNEIARMLSGAPTPTALEHADELLSRARRAGAPVGE